MPNLETIIKQLEAFETNEMNLQAEDRPEGELAQRFWQALLGNKHLTRLHLQGWGLSEAEIKVLADCIVNNPELEELHLDRNQLGDVALALLSPALANSKLYTLSLNGNQITAQGMETLANAVIANGKGTLKVLLLGNNRLEDAGLVPLLHVLQNSATVLQSLSLAKNGLTAAGATTLAQWLRQTGGLAQLFLAANPLGNAGVKVLAQALPTAHHLEWLVLNETGLGDSGLAALSEALPNTQKLRRCEFANNPSLTEPGLDDLEQRLAPKKILQRSYQQWLQVYYLERAILRYDQGYYQHAIATLQKVLRLKSNHSVARLYHDRAVLADIAQRLENYRELLVNPSSSAARQQIEVAIQAFIPVLQIAENNFKQAWQVDLLPSEQIALTQQGRSYQIIWQTLAELLQQPGLSPWFSALRRNKKAELQQLLNYGYEINCPLNTQGITALHYAAQQGKDDLVQWLLGHGARADIKDNQRQFPVDYVPAKQKGGLLRLLREAHYNQMCQKEVKTLQLLTHLTGDAILTADQWLSLKKKIQEIQNNLATLDQLYERSCHNFPEEKARLEALYQQYRDVYEPLWSDPTQLPACHQYKEAQRQAQEDALVQKMMALNPAPGSSADVIQAELLGCYNEFAKIVADLRLLKAISVTTYQQLQAYAITAGWWCTNNPIGVPAIEMQAAFQAAAAGNQTQLIERFIQYPRLLHACSPQGQTLLHVAAQAGQDSLMSWLLKEQALPVTQVDQHGETALHLAARMGQADCLTVLLAAGSDVFRLNTAGLTAFEVALTSFHSNLTAAAMLMTAAGKQLLDVDPDGNTWLHRLIMGRHPQKLALFERVHQAGLAIDAPNKQGNTPLHLATEQGLVDVVIYLLDRGANEQYQNQSGKSPLKLAMEKGDAHIIVPLQQASYERQVGQLTQTLNCFAENYAATSLEVQKLTTDHQERRAQSQRMKEQMQATLAAQQIWEELIALPSRRVFHRQTKAKLTSVLGAAKVLYSSWISSTRKGACGKVADAIDLLGQAIPLPHADKLIALVSLGLRYYDGQQQKNNTAQVANTVDSFQAIDQLAGEVAQLLTQRYQEQLLQLTEKSAACLADCVVGRIIAFTEKQPLDERPLTVQWLEAVAWYSIKQGRLAGLNQTLATAGGQKWTDEGLLQRSGIILPDGRHLIKPDRSRPEKYGFRQGTQEEETRYSLKPYQAPAQSVSAIAYVLPLMSIACGDLQSPAAPTTTTSSHTPPILSELALEAHDKCKLAPS